MRQILLAIFLICTVGSFAQRQNSFFSVDFQMLFPKGSDPGFGGNFSGGGIIKNSALLGGQIGIMKFSGVQSVYIPVQAKFGFTSSFSSKTAPLVLLEPGVGLYSRNYRFGNSEIRQTGGFVFFGGAGVRFRDKKSTSNGFIVIGYSQYGFSTENISSKIEGVSVRFGAFLF